MAMHCSAHERSVDSVMVRNVKCLGLVVYRPDQIWVCFKMESPLVGTVATLWWLVLPLEDGKSTLWYTYSLTGTIVCQYSLLCMW